MNTKQREETISDLLSEIRYRKKRRAQFSVALILLSLFMDLDVPYTWAIMSALGSLYGVSSFMVVTLEDMVRALKKARGD